MSKKGFTLIECNVALLLFSLSFLGALRALIQNNTLLTKQQEQLLALVAYINVQEVGSSFSKHRYLQQNEGIQICNQEQCYDFPFP